jgi:hypothetical protein
MAFDLTQFIQKSRAKVAGGLSGTGTLYGAPPQTVATTPVPKPSFGTTLGAAAGSATHTLTSQGGDKNLALLNAGLGLAGALSYATAKPPVMPKPRTFSSVLPQQNYESFRTRGIGEITRGSRAAYRQAGNRNLGVSGQTAAILGIQAGTDQATGQLESSITDLQRQDRMREAEMLNRDREVNYNAHTQYDQGKFQLDWNNFLGRRQMGAAMAQNALTYAAQRNAGQRQDQQLQLDHENRMKEGQLEAVYRNLSGPERETALRRLGLRKGGLIPRSYRRGGTVPLDAGENRVKMQARQDFQRAISRITTEAMRAFSRSLNQAFATKARKK